MPNIPQKPALGSPKTGKELLDLHYLDARSALLETAATLDRIERADKGSEAFSDPRLQNLMKACDILKNGRANRAEQVLLVLSDPVD
jgi:hypothetical protein